MSKKKPVFEVVPRFGESVRYAVRGALGHVSWFVNSEKGRLRLFVTSGGAQALADQLNAAENITPPAELIPLRNNQD